MRIHCLPVLILGQDWAPFAGFDNSIISWIVVGLILFFGFGVVRFIVTYVRAGRTVRRHIEAPKVTLHEVTAMAASASVPLPYLLVMVPARDESAVIHNTISRLSQLAYPKDRYSVLIITDTREEKHGSEPTTREIATEYAEHFNRDHGDGFIRVLDVPDWYSGSFGSSERTFARSTKGRALNFALDTVHNDPHLSQADMLGILDADGRMHTSVLCEVASKRLTENALLLQGPVFQISNFGQVGLVGKAAGIELSIHHLSTLAKHLLSGKNTARFLAGTNYFIDTHLMMDVGGWNEHALVEDAELGLRVFLEKGVTPSWLSCHEIEQTSPDRRIYLRQRQRWSLGHFQLLPMIKRSNLNWSTKMALRGKILGATLMTPIDAGMPILGWLALVLGWTALMPEALDWVMIVLVVGSVFVWDFFGRGARLLLPYGPIAENRWAFLLLRLQFALAMPWLMILQAQPRVVALFKYLSHKQHDDWEKTPRTVEQISTDAETVSNTMGSEPEITRRKLMGRT